LIAGALSRRYARALVEALAQPEPLEAAGRDLDAFVRLLREHRDLRALFANPGVQRRDKEAILGRVTAGLGLGPIVTTFLGLLLEKGRLGHLEIIVRTYHDLVDERLGRVRAEVTATAPLDAAMQARLADRLAVVAGKRVVLETKTDPGLLGGMVARIGGTVYDGSLRAQLGRLREQLLRG
jgi:F-type H+-transporting ATPase subunit delta